MIRMLASVDVDIYVEYRIRDLLVYFDFGQKHRNFGTYQALYIIRRQSACILRRIRRSCCNTP
jgi:hypothetical protein